MVYINTGGGREKGIDCGYRYTGQGIVEGGIDLYGWMYF